MKCLCSTLDGNEILMRSPSAQLQSYSLEGAAVPRGKTDDAEQSNLKLQHLDVYVEFKVWVSDEFKCIHSAGFCVWTSYKFR